MVEGPGEKFIDAISKLDEVSSELTPEEAAEELDEANLQVFWQEWPDVSAWAGALWRRLNEDLAEPAAPVTDPELDESGGGG